MKMYFNLVMSAMSIAVLAGCAHTHNVDGPQEPAKIPAGIRVGIGGKEVKEGDKVSVLKPLCDTRTGREGLPTSRCKDQKVGEAVVLKVLDHDSAIVQPSENLQMDTSMKVERQ